MWTYFLSDSLLLIHDYRTAGSILQYFFRMKDVQIKSILMNENSEKVSWDSSLRPERSLRVLRVWSPLIALQTKPVSVFQVSCEVRVWPLNFQEQRHHEWWPAGAEHSSRSSARRRRGAPSYWRSSLKSEPRAPESHTALRPLWSTDCIQNRTGIKTESNRE